MPDPVAPTSATFSPGSTGEGHVLDRGPLSVIREADILERHLAGEPPDVLGVRAIVHGRRGVENLEELAHFRRLHEHLVDEADRLLEARDQHRGDAHEHDDLADGREPVQMQAGADEKHRRHRDGGRGARRHGGDRPPGQNRVLRLQQLLDDGAQRAGLRLDAREGLDHRHIAERVGGVLGEARMIALDGALQALGLAHHDGGQDGEDDDQPDEQQRRAAN